MSAPTFSTFRPSAHHVSADLDRSAEGGGGASSQLGDYDYVLPDERIAQEPVTPRDAARLLCVPRRANGVDAGGLTHRVFRELPELLQNGDLLVVNETRVTAVRLFGLRDGMTAPTEALLLRPALEYDPTGVTCYEALVRPGKKLPIGVRIVFEDAGLSAEVAARTESGGRILRFAPLHMGDADVTELLEAHGRTPLPPYITAPLADKSRYQTVYAQTPGSAAAPTAGLHFTPDLLARLEASGVGVARIRLDVGLGTFRPVRVTNLAEHEMHREAFAVSVEAARAVNECRGRVVAVGTTSLRALETAGLEAEAQGSGARIVAMSGETQLFIRPGAHTFRAADALITNFHQPHSTLLLLVAAFAGRAQMRHAYQTALDAGYRFLSFGDAMFAFPGEDAAR